MIFDKKILGLIIFVVLVTGCSANAQHPVTSEYRVFEEIAVEDDRNIDGISKIKQDNFKEQFIEIDEIDMLGEIESGYIYFGRPDCPYCNIMEQTLFDVLNELNLEIYYFETSKFRDNENFDEILNNYLVQYVPTLIYKKNSEIIIFNIEDEAFFDESNLKAELIKFLNQL